MSPRPLIDRILRNFRSFRKDHPAHDASAFGFRIEYGQGEIHDGDYGDPEADHRPEFVKKDEIGWKRLR